MKMEEKLSFAQVWDKAVTQGSKIARRKWKAFTDVKVSGDSININVSDGTGGCSLPWKPSHEDLLAQDWFIVTTY